jgi:hypothetical protein
MGHPQTQDHGQRGEEQGGFDSGWVCGTVVQGGRRAEQRDEEQQKRHPPAAGAQALESCAQKGSHGGDLFLDHNHATGAREHFEFRPANTPVLHNWLEGHALGDPMAGDAQIGQQGGHCVHVPSLLLAK